MGRAIVWFLEIIPLKSDVSFGGGGGYKSETCLDMIMVEITAPSQEWNQFFLMLCILFLYYFLIHYDIRCTV